MAASVVTGTCWWRCCTTIRRSSRSADTSSGHTSCTSRPHSGRRGSRRCRSEAGLHRCWAPLDRSCSRGRTRHLCAKRGDHLLARRARAALGAAGTRGYAERVAADLRADAAVAVLVRDAGDANTAIGESFAAPVAVGRVPPALRAAAARHERKREATGERQEERACMGDGRGSDHDALTWAALG